MDALESRQLRAADFPTATEQYLVELVNRARLNPTTEAALQGIDLNEGLAAGTISPAPKQPLAINPVLVDAAGKHSQWQIDNDILSHNEGTLNPEARMQAAGYAFIGSSAAGENIGWRGSTSIPDQTFTTMRLHNDLFIDAGMVTRPHRTTLMYSGFKEIGTGVVSGLMLYQGTNWNAVMATEDFAASTGNVGGDSFLTGVAYTDAITRDSFYTVGEGIGGVTVKATRSSDNAVFSTTTWDSGGYSLRLMPGTYTVTASGVGMPTQTYGNVVIGSENVKRDFIPGVDTTAPTASNGTFVVNSSPMKITVAFSEPVSGLTSSKLELRKVGSSALIPVTLSGIDANNVATFTIPANLADGNYRATLPAQSVTDLVGNPLASAYNVDFFMLAGDASRNGVVDSADFTIVSQNFNKTDMTFTQGDFNADGKVNALDFNVLASKFGAAVPAPLPAANLGTANLFNDQTAIRGPEDLLM